MSAAVGPWTPESALAPLLARIVPVECESVPLSRAAGRVLARAVHADRPSPPCDVSAMDGYAIRSEDLRRPVIPVAGEILPGSAPIPLPAGAALRIVTGAPVPAEAQLVIRREDVEREAPDHIVLRPGLAPAIGQHIRRRGENAPAGQRIAGQGDFISPAVVSALAAMGISEPAVYRPVRLGIITTGDELVPIGAPMEPWQIRDSNGPQLAALASRCPWIAIVRQAHVRDEEPALRAELRRAIDTCDAVLLTGGVSMGSHDFVPAAVKSIGAEVLFHRLPIKPGKPILAAITSAGRPVLALPGNPVSVLATACRFAGPALRTLAGFAAVSRAALTVALEAPVPAADLWRFIPVRLIATGAASAVVNRGSGDLVAVAGSDGFVDLPPGDSAGPLAFFRWEW